MPRDKDRNGGERGRKTVTAQPRLHQKAGEIQRYGTVTPMLPLELEPVRLEMTEQLNQLLADTMTLRDLYKKSHWQVAGPTFYQLHGPTGCRWLVPESIPSAMAVRICQSATICQLERPCQGHRSLGVKPR